MAHRNVRTTDFEERDYYTAPRRSAPELVEDDYRRRTVTISPPRSRASEDRTPAFLREDARRTEAGPVVLRQRQVETVDRHRHRSPSPITRVREERLVRRPRSLSPASYKDQEFERSRTRITERERERVREPSRKRSPSPRVIRYVERPRPSPSPPIEEERIRTRIVEREKERIPSRAPSPVPPPKPEVIKGPIIEREVITHYRDIDHGVVQVRPPSPPPAPKPRARSRSRVRERETDIDIQLSKGKTEVDVDIRRSVSRHRSPSRERRSKYHDDDLVIRRDERLIVDESSRRRAHSAAPRSSAVDEEAEYLTSKVDSRGRMGEAWGGATKDWAIVDVPPGTERIRMDGIGGGSTDTTWTRYSGVRRTKFIPERDGELVPVPLPLPSPKEPSPPPTRDRLSVSVYDRDREIDIEKVTDRRITRPAPQPQPRDMWTEITKDLVVREAIEEIGYEYEETDKFFYIMEYLKYDDVLRLVDISDEIRRARKQRTREIEREREYYDDIEWERSRHGHYPKWDEVVEREVVYDSRRPRRYIR